VDFWDSETPPLSPKPHIGVTFKTRRPSPAPNKEISDPGESTQSGVAAAGGWSRPRCENVGKPRFAFGAGLTTSSHGHPQRVHTIVYMFFFNLFELGVRFVHFYSPISRENNLSSRSARMGGHIDCYVDICRSAPQRPLKQPKLTLVSASFYSYIIFLDLLQNQSLLKSHSVRVE
jgi:hypothetical protein